VRQEIVRLDDPRVEAFRHVAEPAWLAARGLFVAEGRLVVERLLRLPGYEIVSVLLTPTAHAALAPSLPPSAPVLVAPPAVVEQVTGFNFHRGCLALAKRPARRGIDAIAAARSLVVLEGVGNPDNVGGIFRSAAAFGVEAVGLDPACADPFYRKAIRTSMGATLRVPSAVLAPWPDALGGLKDAGFTIAALSPAGGMSVEALADLAGGGRRLALLAGAEGPGLTSAALNFADRTVRIPIDPASDSLNVVVAVSIALHRSSG
jgi:tRNA G18 (ribose-2'-O)-methylase SpoU